jgi:teichuronic acid biosynthesis glycosyltransferase TuaC
MSEKSLHIIIIASWYKNTEQPTIGCFIEEQARMLQKIGHKVTIIHPYLKGTFFSTLKKRDTIVTQENDGGIKTIRIGVAPYLPRFRTLSYKKLFQHTEKVINQYILKNGRPDLIHSHALFVGGVIGMYLSEKLKIPQFHTEHTSGLLFQREQYSKGDVSLLKKVYTHSKMVYFVSEFAKNNISKLYGITTENFTVVSNVVDPIFFEIVPKPIESPSKFIIIADFISIKNHKLLLDAWKIYLSLHPDNTLTIVGEGEKLNELTSHAEELNIDHSIIWLKKQARNEIKQLILDHDIVLSTSKLETFGMTIAEAIASGKPVVVTDSGGVRDIVEPSNGIITQQNADGFSWGLLSIKSEFKKYDSKKIQADAKLKFSEEAIYTVLQAKYQHFVKT